MKPTQNWVDAYLGLGSNLDDPRRQVLTAVDEIKALADIRVIQLSPLYASEPLGPQDQPDYINAVMHIQTRLAALDLLKCLQQIESQHHRVRQVHWGARTLDLDLLLYGEQRIMEADLTVPHPELSKRPFVLYPLADIADENLNIPDQGSLPDLLNACPRQGLWRLA